MCILLTLAPWSSFLSPAHPPLLPLIAVGFWAGIPLYSVFGLGLLQDVLTGAPLGFWACLYVLVVGLTLLWRALLAGGGLFVEWGAFALTCLFVVGAACVLGLLWRWEWLWIGPFFGQMLLTAAAYPLVSACLGMVERFFDKEG